MNRLPNETMQQYRGRKKRETNLANDALDLKEGEPIQIGGRKARFHLRMVDRMRPYSMRRLEGDELSLFLATERSKQEQQDRITHAQAEREAFLSLPNVQDANAIRYILEDRLKEVIDRLTPAEWSEFRKRLES